MKPVRCLDCDYLAGSERTPQWLFVTGRGYCDHEERRGGPWNVLQEIGNPSRMCARFKPAAPERIEQRERALKILRERLGERYQETVRALPASRKGELEP